MRPSVVLLEHFLIAESKVACNQSPSRSPAQGKRVQRLSVWQRQEDPAERRQFGGIVWRCHTDRPLDALPLFCRRT